MKTALTAKLGPARSATPGIRLVAGGASLLCLALALAGVPVGLAGIALAAALVIVGVALVPAIGLMLVAAAIPFGQAVTLPLPGIGLLDVLVGLTAFAWLLRGFSEHRIVFQPPPLTWPLLAFVWVSGLSLTQASSWREGVPEWLKWGEFAALYLVGSQVLCRRWSRGVLAALLLAGVGQAMIGAYQFWGQVGPEAFTVMGRFVRAHGTFRQPNPYAGYLGYLAPLSISIAITAAARWSAGRRPADLALAAGCLTAGAALSAGMVMSWSRGAWIGLAASLAVVVGMRNRRAAALALGAALLLALLTATSGAGWLPGSVAARVSDLGNYVSIPEPARVEINDANFSVLERLAHWEAGLRMFDLHPWLGVGIGNYAVAYPAYAPPHWYEPLGHAHNIFINILAETGALGLATFGVFWLGVGALALRRARGGSGLQRALAVGLLGTWIYVSVHSLFDNLFVQHIQLQLALLLAALRAETDVPS